MKKIKYLLLTILLLVPFNIKAATINCSAPSSVESGETFSVTFSGSLSSAASIWIAKVGSEGNVSYSSGGLSIVSESSSMSHTVSFLAGNPGSAKFYAYDMDVSDGNKTYTDSATCYVEITSATSSNGVSANVYDTNDNDNNDDDSNKSSNNFLKTLSIEGVKLNKKFNKDTLEYSSIVSGDVEKVSINAEAEDETASVDGIGEKELKEGINKFEIVVTAEDGQTRKYVVTITRKEKNPIEVTINKKNYTVIKKDIKLDVPVGFVKTSIIIDKQEVEAYSNSFTGYILVALVDEDGNAGWFIYNQKNGTYTKYREFKSSGLRLIILEANKKDVPYKYKKCKVEINNEIVDGYALQYNSPYRLVYALNMDTGNKAFYLYDMDENTFQRLYNSQVDIYRKLVKKFEIALIVIAGLFLIMSIVIISQFVINKKTKRFIKNGGKKEEYKPVIEDQDLDDEKEQEKEKLKNIIKEKNKKLSEEKQEESDNNETNVKANEEEKPLTRSELRRKKKEEKARLEEERREFFR